MWRPPRCAQTATRRVKFLMTASIMSCPIRRVSATMFAFSFAIVLGFDEYTLSFRWPQRKKSGGVKSGEWGDHSIGHLRLMTRCPKWAWSHLSVLLAVCGVAPFLWRHYAVIYVSRKKKNPQRKLLKIHFNFYCRKAFSKSFERHRGKTVHVSI